MSRHAYLIMVHEHSASLLALLDMLDDERNDVFLHVDGKKHGVLKKISSLSLRKARLFVLPHPVSVYWGHTSQVKAEFLLMRTAAAAGRYDYYHLLSGNDLPVKTQDEIHRFFGRHRGTEFVGFWDDESHRRDVRRKVRYYYFFNRYKERANPVLHSITSPIRNLLLGVQKLCGIDRQKHNPWEVKKGFNWFSITDECCRYLLSQETKVKRMFHYTLCPDEMFLQTVVWNSPFRSRLYDTEDAQTGSLRAIDWERGTPYIWRQTDVSALVESPYLFARKFASNDGETIEALTKCLAARRSSSSPHPESIATTD